MQFGPFLFPEGPGAGCLPQITEALQAVLAPTAGSLGRPRPGMSEPQEGPLPGWGCLYLCSHQFQIYCKTGKYSVPPRPLGMAAESCSGSEGIN